MDLERHKTLIQMLVYEPTNPQHWLQLAEEFVRKSDDWKAILCYEQAYLLQPESFQLAKQINQFILKTNFDRFLEPTPPNYHFDGLICIKCGAIEKSKDSFLCSCGGLMGPTLKRRDEELSLYPRIFPRTAYLSTDRRYLLVNLHQACVLFGEATKGLPTGEGLELAAVKETDYRSLLGIHQIPIFPWLIYYVASPAGKQLSATQDIYFNLIAYLGIHTVTLSPLGNQALLGLRIPCFRPDNFNVFIKEQIIRWPLHQVLFQREFTLGDEKLPDLLSTQLREKTLFEWDFEKKCFRYVDEDSGTLLLNAFPGQELFQPFSCKKIPIDRSPLITIDGYHSPLWNSNKNKIRKLILSH